MRTMTKYRYEWVVPPVDAHATTSALQTALGLRLRKESPEEPPTDGHIELTEIEEGRGKHRRVIAGLFALVTYHTPLTDAQQALAKATVGEHPDFTLTGDDAHDAPVLESLGLV